MAVNAARDVIGRLRILRAKAETDAPRAACTAIGQTAETAIKVTLTSSSHPKGTSTPSRPGMPPSLVTGRLRRSILATPARPAGPAIFACLVGSHLIYAPVHEFGPVTIRARRFPVLGNPEVGFFGPQVTIPRRPYISRSTERLIGSGMLARVATEAWQAAVDL